jgi:hypothetical protein
LWQDVGLLDGVQVILPENAARFPVPCYGRRIFLANLRCVNRITGSQPLRQVGVGGCAHCAQGPGMGYQRCL